MPWVKTAADRKRDAAAYDRTYRRNRAACLERDRWRCQIRLEGCQGAASQCDHIIPVSNGGTHDMDNLRAACEGCHRRKSAMEGGGYRASRTVPDPAPRPSTNW